MITVFAYGYHTEMVWGFSRDAVERDRAQLIHSPSEAVTYVAAIDLQEVEDDWHQVCI
jgi:hypothetical protein